MDSLLHIEYMIKIRKKIKFFSRRKNLKPGGMTLFLLVISNLI